MLTEVEARIFFVLVDTYASGHDFLQHEHNRVGHHERAHQRGEHRDELVAEQRQATTEEHTIGPDLVDGLVGEEPEQQRPDDTADQVHADDVERVVVLQPELDCIAPVAHHARDQADGDRRHAADEARARRDRDEPGDRARRAAERGRVAAVHALDDQPAEHRGGRRHVRVHQRLRRDPVRAEGRAGVEPEPAEPQDAGADQRERRASAAASACPASRAGARAPAPPRAPQCRR